MEKTGLNENSDEIYRNRLEVYDEIEQKEKKKDEIEKQLFFEHKKELLRQELESSRDVIFLKSLIERGELTRDIVEVIVSNSEFSKEQVEELFKKIEEFELLQKICLPKELIFTKDDYILALTSEDNRQKGIIKLDNILDFLFSNDGSIGDISGTFHIFGYLSENLQKIHSKTIEIKKSLE